ncbi:MAG: Smr/MutS family protein [Acidobacteriota bacterium]
MEASLRALEFDRVLALIALETRTSIGRSALLRRRPEATLDACENGQAELWEMTRFYLHEGLLPLAGVADMASLFEKDSLLELDESWLVLRAIRGTQAVREALTRSEGYLRLSAIAEHIPELSELTRAVSRFFTADGKLREDSSAELRTIRSRMQTRRRSIQQVLSELLSRQGDALQEAIITLRGDRYCVPVRSDHRSSVPGILHERSGSGATLFVEPMQIVEMNNDLAELAIMEREEIARITRFVADMILAEMPRIGPALEVVGELDAIQACAVFGRTIEASRPTFSEARELILHEGRHPLLDERLADARRSAFGEEISPERVIPVGFELRVGKPALLVSGPNAGGKTVALKTAGLTTAMAASGLPVPVAEGTVIPVVDSIHVLIGDDQSVLEHLSTFSAYLVRLKRILDNATSRSLVLLDELGSGTDPEEGSALAASVIERLLEIGTLLVVTTHLSALKTFALSDDRIGNASMEFDAVTGSSTYRMNLGVPGRSRAIEVAEMIGLPASILASARERLGERYGDMDRLIGELQRTLSEAAETRQELSDLRREAAGAADAARIDRERAAHERKELSKKYRTEIEELKREVSSRLNDELRRLKKHEARPGPAAEASYERIVQPIERRGEFAPETSELQVGQSVQHRLFRIHGTVASMAGDRITLLAGGKKIEVDRKDLTSPETAAPAPRGRERPSTKPTASETEQDVSAELNLIGKRVEEALEECDRFLDRALLEGRGAVRLIHGFGTGALRKGIREHLRKHPAAKTFRGGNEREGGDGSTVVVLDN